MLIAGLYSPSGGQLRIGGQPVTRPRTDIGIVFQSPVLLDWRRVLDNVMLQVETRRLDKALYRRRSLDLLDAVGLAGFEHTYPYALSGGMRQRVSICRALIHDPPLLLMDEPFGALDALTREQLMIDLQRMWAGGHQTVVFVTHSIREAVPGGRLPVGPGDRPVAPSGPYRADLADRPATPPTAQNGDHPVLHPLYTGDYRSFHEQGRHSRRAGMIFWNLASPLLSMFGGPPSS